MTPINRFRQQVTEICAYSMSFGRSFPVRERSETYAMQVTRYRVIFRWLITAQSAGIKGTFHPASVLTRDEKQK